jgi:site-specific DNA-cytosine methylase
MKVLIACEYSGRVRDAFKALGHDAMSCDLLPTDAPGKHYQGDVFDIINDGWDLMIAHPPCTYLSVSGMHWTTRGLRDPQLTEDALDFVRLLLDAPIERIAIENPVSVISSRIRKPNQIIHPWMFGHDASKKTCLWLKNLPLLKFTNVIEGDVYCCGMKVYENDFYGCSNCNGEKKGKRIYANQTASGQNKLPPSKDRWKLRSTTYQGIADAMAAQWGNVC